MSSVELAPALSRVLAALEGLDAPWYLGGGWAADALIGRVTREHHDVDIVAFMQHQHIIREHLPNWRLVAHDDNVPGATKRTWDARDLTMPAHIHVFGDETLEWEFQLNYGPAEEWIFHGNPGFTLPFEECICDSAWGIPILAPVVNLYYKALPPMWRDEPRHPPRPHDHHDFELLLPHLSDAHRAWLREAIAALEPEHAWLGRLAG